MKIKLLIVSCIVLLVALVGATQSHSQESPLDLGETNLLLMACDFIRDKAIDEDVSLKYCRRAEPEEIIGNKASLKIKIKSEFNEKIYIDIDFRKSIWWLDSWEIYARE